MKPIRNALIINGKTYKVIRKHYLATIYANVCEQCDLRKRCDGHNFCEPFWKKDHVPYFKLVKEKKEKTDDGSDTRQPQ